MTRALAAFSLGLALTVVAAAFGSASLYVPGIALILLSAGSAAWVVVAARGARVLRAPAPATVEEGQPYPLDLRVVRGFAPAFGELRDPQLAAPVRLGDLDEGRLRRELRFTRRGRRPLDGARLVLRDPLGLARREVQAETAAVLVLPRVEPVVEHGHANQGGSRGGGRLSAHHAELELDSLRPYRAGAPASRIHWPTVARSQTMVERRLIADVDARPLVVVDPRHSPSDDALDAALRAAASLCVHLARSGGCGVLLPGDRRATTVKPDLRAWPALHARIALVDAAGDASFAGRIERGGAVFWVAALGNAPVGIARAAAPLRYLVTPDRPGAGLVEFTVAGCFGRRLGRTARSAA